MDTRDPPVCWMMACCRVGWNVTGESPVASVRMTNFSSGSACVVIVLCSGPGIPARLSGQLVVMHSSAEHELARPQSPWLGRPPVVAVELDQAGSGPLLDGKPGPGQSSTGCSRELVVARIWLAEPLDWTPAFGLRGK